MKKTNFIAKDIDEYLANVDEKSLISLEKLRQMINEILPDSKECISYQIPTFKYKNRLLIAFASFKNHCSLFPMSSTVIEKLSPIDLKNLKIAGKTLHFQKGEILPFDLVKKIIEIRIEQNDLIESRKKTKKS